MGGRRWGRVLAIGGLAVLMAGCTPVPTPPTATPSPLVFPETVVGAVATDTLTITNTDPDVDLIVESVGIAGPDGDQFGDGFDDDAAVTVPPGESTTVEVTYEPTEAGAHEATLRVGYAELSIAVPLSGTAVASSPGESPLVAEPTTAAFPTTVVGQTTTVQVEVRNAGSTDPIVVEDAEVTGMFDAELPGAPVTLDPDETAVVTVSFSPTAAGDRTAQLRIPHDGSIGDVVVPLTATGRLSGPPAVLHRINAGGPALPGWAADTAAVPSPYANVPAGGNTVAKTTATIDLTDPSVPAGTPAAVFQDERTDQAAAPNLTYALPVEAGRPVEVRVYLAATAPAAQAAGARLFDVRIDGAVVAPDVDVFARVGANRGLVLTFPVVSDGSVDVELRHGAGLPAIAGLDVMTATEPPPPILTVPSIDIPGAIVRQTATDDAVLTNTGAAPLTITSTAVTGIHAKQFADRFPDGQPRVLAPGAATTVPVAFLADGGGPRVATLIVNHDGANSPTKVALTGTASPPPPTFQPSFGKSQLNGVIVNQGTSLQFGPDGRLYVSELDGHILALTIARNGDNNYVVSDTEPIDLVHDLPNRNDNGAPNPEVSGRLITGLLAAGTPDEPVLYVSSSDPRQGGGPFGSDANLDTNSGVVSRLERDDGVWTKVDLVRGLPRSEENHTGNGMVLDPATGDLLLAYGGNTNKGAPSHNFALLPEYALSAAVLAIDLDALGDTPYDLPTLDDETRPGATDVHDPFGGNDGRNMARLMPGGPVRVYAPGFRNPYDLVRTQAGDLYTIDNGGNAGWGGAPLTCTNDRQEASDTDSDSLMRITGEGFYGGHPNPTRANLANTFNPSNPQSPVSAANPVECEYRTEVERGALAVFPFSTNGIVEYTAGNFGGALQGDLLAAGFDGGIHRVQLTPDGGAVAHHAALFTSAAVVPLDVAAQGDEGPFPGTVWVADVFGSRITVFEPADFACTGADDAGLDEDGDGFDNADELDNGTNPCSAADVPPDADGDHISDRNDPDDDNDTRPDTSDRFALDPDDGRTTALPVTYTWDNNAPPAGGLLDLGFTGLMTNGTTNYATLFDPTRMTAGGAAGVVTVDEAGDGDAVGPLNTQHNGFQFGIDVDPSTAPFVVHTRLPAPFAGLNPVGNQSYGVFFGTGTQDDYVKLSVAANGGAGGFSLAREVNGGVTLIGAPGPDWPAGGPTVDLFLHVDPAAATVTATYSLDGAAPIQVGPTQAVPTSWFTSAAGPAVGIISTSSGPAPPFPATWDFLKVLPG